MKRLLSGLVITIVFLLNEPETLKAAPSISSLQDGEIGQGGCCTFNTPDLCSWSPAFISNGWWWSGEVQPQTAVPAKDSPYIFVDNGSAGAISSNITEVTAGTTITFTYYFSSAKYDDYNRLEVGFFNSEGYVVPFDTELEPVNEWTTKTITCGEECCYSVAPECVDSCCSEVAAHCYGSFYINAFNSPTVHFVAALDDFHVNDATCN